MEDPWERGSEDPDYGEDGSEGPLGISDSQMEKITGVATSSTQMADMMFDEALPLAAEGIIKIARNGSGRLKFDACKYILAVKGIGPLVQDAKEQGKAKQEDAWREFTKELEKEGREQ